MISRLFISTAFLISVQFCFSQNTIEYKTWNPASDTMQVLEGQAWPNEVNDFYDRLPARAEKSVRDIVWDFQKTVPACKCVFKPMLNEIIIKYYSYRGIANAPHAGYRCKRY